MSKTTILVKRGRPAWTGKLLCGHRRPHHARGLCVACYHKLPDIQKREAGRKKDRDWNDPPIVREINRWVRENPTIKPMPDPVFRSIMQNTR